MGYAGGKTDWPTYKSIQDHTEALRVEFDPALLSYKDILSEFFSQHSPTSPAYSRQYRSALFYHNEEQRKEAADFIDMIESRTGRKIYTDLEPATDFYQAEEYHLKYIEKANKSRRW